MMRERAHSLLGRLRALPRTSYDSFMSLPPQGKMFAGAALLVHVVVGAPFWLLGPARVFECAPIFTLCMCMCANGARCAVLVDAAKWLAAHPHSGPWILVSIVRALTAPLTPPRRD